MTIRDFLTLNHHCIDDHVEICYRTKTILKTQPISKLHCAWLSFEIESFIIVPHEYSNIEVVYIFYIDMYSRVLQHVTWIDDYLDKEQKHDI